MLLARLGLVVAIGIVVNWPCRIPGRRHCVDERRHRRALHVDRRPFRSEIDSRLNHPRGASQRSLDGGHARGAGHPLDREMHGGVGLPGPTAIVDRGNAWLHHGGSAARTVQIGGGVRLERGQTAF